MIPRFDQHNSQDDAKDMWRVGDVLVKKVYETTLARHTVYDLLNVTPHDVDPMRSWMRPYLGPKDEMLMSVHSFCIEADGERILVDTCIGNHRQFKWALVAEIFNGLDTRFLADLAASGFGPKDVDTVVCTHLHLDHIGYNTTLSDGLWVPTFPNARYVFSAVDHDSWRSAGFPSHREKEADYDHAYQTSVHPLIAHGVSEMVCPQSFEISPSVSLLPTPGHTPDHFSVKIESRGEIAIITGDAVHSPMQLIRPDWSSVADADPLLSAESRRSLSDYAQEVGALVLGTHFPGPTAGFIYGSGDDRRFVSL